jgi:ubiquitin C-terminal hydrolase
MKGFNNLGNTCYLNAGLQMLIQNKDLCTVITSLSNKNPVLKKLSEFINKYYDNTNESISPSYIKELISERNDIFMGFHQQDSSEFIVFFLDFINSEVNKILPGKNIIDKLFEINEKTTTKCKVLSCLTTSDSIEKSTILMLNISNDSETLDDCLQFSKQRIKLEGDNKYYCEKCEKKRIASQRKEVNIWPKNLIVWLRRYEQIGTRLSKHSQEIKVPIIWRNNYKLKGVVFHSGNLYGGHYIYAGNVNDKWYLFDDSSVSELNNNSLSNIVNNGYIYYYTKEF